jgi:hypothetical protein
MSEGSHGCGCGGAGHGECGEHHDAHQDCGCNEHRGRREAEHGCGCGEKHGHDQGGGCSCGGHHGSHHGSQCSCGCHHEGGCCRGGGHCEGDHACHCERRHGFHRRFQTRDERIAELESYLKELEAEAQGVREAIAGLGTSQPPAQG